MIYCAGLELHALLSPTGTRYALVYTQEYVKHAGLIATVAVAEAFWWEVFCQVTTKMTSQGSM